MPEPKVLLGGLGMPESPRWHEGRLWFCNWIDRQVVAVDLEGQAEVMVTRDPASHPMGCTVEWYLADRAPVNLARLSTGPRTGEILALPVDVPGVGRP